MASSFRLSPLRRIGYALPGFVQAAAAFCPAARVRFYGTISFLRLHDMGGALLGLGLALAIAGIFRKGRWAAVCSVLSLVITAGMYWRLAYSPSASFADPVLRHAVRPTWGFWPMAGAACAGLLLAAWFGIRARQRGESLTIDASVPPSVASVPQ